MALSATRQVVVATAEAISSALRSPSFLNQMVLTRMGMAIIYSPVATGRAGSVIHSLHEPG